MKNIFLQRIENEPEFKKYVLSLEGKRVACFCKPKRCHLDTIVNYIYKGDKIKVCIFGSREFDNYELLKQIIQDSKFKISEVVCGEAKGADLLGRKWAEENNIPVSSFPANWNDLDAPGAKIETNKWGKQYNKLAGHQRNEEMCDYAEAFITPGGGSPGTDGMIKLVKKSGKPLYIHSDHNCVEF